MGKSISKMFLKKVTMLMKEYDKRLVDISFLLRFDHLKSYLCEASELREIRNFF